MDCGIFSKKNKNTRDRVDRFVLPREYFNEMCQRPRLLRPLEPCQSLRDRLKYNKFKSHLDQILGVVYVSHRKPEAERWPCVPRKKSFLSSAHNILDLPRYSDSTFPDLLDWSKDNILVAALGNYYHKLSCNSQSIVSRVFTHYEIQCCRFDPRGELLVLGTHLRRVEIHNNERNKRVNVGLCPCNALCSSHICSVTAVDWSPTGNSFVIGCTNGTVTALARSALVVATNHALRQPVLLARVSPDARYVAVSGVNSTTVHLLTWPNLVYYSNIESECLVKAITWHPWRSALLGIGAMDSDLVARVALWNAPTKELRVANLGPTQYGIDTMLFSERTGELVASLWNSADFIYHNMYTQLVVLSDSQTVVDQWGAGVKWPDQVRTMVFNPDGTKLATATMGEDLIIWNFLPEDKVKRNTKRNRFSAMPVYLDKAEHGFSFR